MPLVKAVCTSCGASLEVDNAKDAAICPYCSTPYIVEKAINQYVMNVNNLNAGVVNLVQEDKSEKLFKNAATQLMLGEFDSAFSSYDDLSISHSYDPRSWAGLLSAKSKNKKIIDFGTYDVENIKRYYKNLEKLDIDAAKEWKEYCEAVVEAFKTKKEKLAQMEREESVLEKKSKDYELIGRVMIVLGVFSLFSFFGIISSITYSNGNMILILLLLCIFASPLIAGFILLYCSKEKKTAKEKLSKKISEFSQMLNSGKWERKVK